MAHRLSLLVPTDRRLLLAKRSAPDAVREAGADGLWFTEPAATPSGTQTSGDVSPPTALPSALTPPPLEHPAPPPQRWPSRQMQFVARILSTERKLMDDAEEFSQFYQGRPDAHPAPVPLALRMVASVTEREVRGRRVFRVEPHVTPPSPWHIVYLHGGGFVNTIIGPHWDIVLQLVRHTGATVTVPLYPLAPRHTYKDGLAFVEEVVRDLSAAVPPERIVLAGDSAGGCIAIVTAMRLRDAGAPGPGRLVLFSPCTSVVEGSAEVDDIEPTDPILARPGGMLAGRWWAGLDDPSIPEVSPLFGDLAGLPPLQIFQGTRDILLPDVRLFAERVHDAGGDVELRIYPGAIHVFVGATFTPEAQDAFRAVAAGLEASAPEYARLQRVVTSHLGVFPRQVAARARAQGTPWIQHGRRAAETWRQRAVTARRPLRLAG